MHEAWRDLVLHIHNRKGGGGTRNLLEFLECVWNQITYTWSTFDTNINGRYSSWEVKPIYLSNSMYHMTCWFVANFSNGSFKTHIPEHPDSSALENCVLWSLCHRILSSKLLCNMFFFLIIIIMSQFFLSFTKKKTYNLYAE